MKWDSGSSRQARVSSRAAVTAKARNGLLALSAITLVGVSVVGCGSSDSTDTSSTGSSTGSTADSSAIVKQAKAFVAPLESATARWDGPTTGPRIEPNKTIAYIACTSSTPICLQVGSEVQSIAKKVGWNVKVFNGGDGTQQEVTAAWDQALATKPAGIINGATDAAANKASLLEAKKQGIPVVGVLSTSKVGAADDVNEFTNVSQDPREIGKALAMYSIAQTDGKAKVAIDSVANYGIAKEKSDEMQEVFKQCSTCKVLAVNYADFSTLQTDTPQLISSWVSKFGSDFWILAVADSMITPMIAPLQQGGVPPSGVKIVGSDGAPDVYGRIGAGQYQVASIPQSPDQLAYQAVDELNRALQGGKPTGFAQPLHIITKANVNENGGKNKVYTGTLGYQDQYEKIWTGK